jgi:hypothetical protein
VEQRADGEADLDARVRDGLYSLAIEMSGDRRGHATGIVVLRDGLILGGDSFFYYTGTYSFSRGKWRGEMIVNQHTEAPGAQPRVRRPRGDLRLHRHLFRGQRRYRWHRAGRPQQRPVPRAPGPEGANGGSVSRALAYLAPLAGRGRIACSEAECDAGEGAFRQSR